MDDLVDWFAGVDELLPVDGTFCVQFVDAGFVVKNTLVDQLYSEHTYLHSLNSVVALGKKFGFYVHYFEVNRSQGGSYFVVLKKSRPRKEISKTLHDALASELVTRDEGMFENFEHRFNHLKLLWNQISQIFFSRGSKLIGIGASLRGISLINFLDIPSTLFSHIVEVNPEKIGKWTPQSKIFIKEEDFFGELPEYFLVLAWTQKSFLLEKYSFLIERGASLIIPSPTLEVIGTDPFNLRGLTSGVSI
jgi:hypothetical protein